MSKMGSHVVLNLTPLRSKEPAIRRKLQRPHVDPKVYSNSNSSSSQQSRARQCLLSNMSVNFKKYSKHHSTQTDNPSKEANMLIKLAEDYHTSLFHLLFFLLILDSLPVFCGNVAF